MAEVKKEKSKEKPEGWNFDPIETVIVLLFLILLLGALVPTIRSFFSLDGSGNGGGNKLFSFFGFSFSDLIDFFRNNLQFLKALGFVLAGIAALGTFVFTKLGDAIVLAEKAKLFPMGIRGGQTGVGETVVPVSVDKVSKEKQLNRWEKVIKLSESESSSDWRLAVIEADIMLGELLDKMQLPGETIGEKLKAVEESDFITLNQAWEAHKARNMIAHEGSNFLVNQREIRRIVSLYKVVFKEFNLI